MNKALVFDCDSTLSSIEGIDELARLAGPETFRQVEDLTNQAMNGDFPLDEVFSRRLALIQPDKAMCEKVAQLYRDTVEPTAKETIAAFQKKGWDCVLLSGGFKVLIEPLAADLGISRIEAVPLHFQGDGSYQSFDNSYPTTYNGGKPEIIRQLRKEKGYETIVMIGDGVSDLETKPDVEAFVAYAGYVSREKVISGATHTIHQLDQLNSLALD